MVETDLGKGLRESSWTGYIGFTVKSRDTEENQMIHDAFRNFCKAETENNYTQGLKVLLDYFSSDMKYEAIWDTLKALEVKVVELEEKTKKPEKSNDEDEGGAF